MKKTITFLIFVLYCTISNSQNPEAAAKLVDEGISYHDKGDYEGAIAQYDKALALDTNNMIALGEKALSFLAWGKYEEAVNTALKTIETHPNDINLEGVYVTCGNAYDGLKKTDKAIETYDEGIKKFPDAYQLYFNKGITLSTVDKPDEAIACFQKAVILNPNHPGSNNAIARLMKQQNRRIASILAYSRFFILEPQSNRAKANLTSLQSLLNANVKKTGKNSISLNISPELLADTTINGKPKENSFSSVDLLLSMSTALNYDKKYKKYTEVEHFIRNFGAICSSLKETQKENYGFFWDYYVPYFIEMNEKNFTETFGYITFASSESEDVSKWLKSHQKEVDEFYKWSENYLWFGN